MTNYVKIANRHGFPFNQLKQFAKVVKNPNDTEIDNYMEFFEWLESRGKSQGHQRSTFYRLHEARNIMNPIIPPIIVAYVFSKMYSESYTIQEHLDQLQKFMDTNPISFPFPRLYDVFFQLDPSID